MLAFLLSVFLQLSPLVVFDSLVHDFGANPADTKELVCSFEFRNGSDSNVSIAYALATCPCTTVSWTRDVVVPGAKGYVRAVFEQELFSDRFEKTISVFFEGEPKPVILTIQGSFYDTPETLAADFPARRGSLGLESDIISISELAVGREFLGRFFVANTGYVPIDVRLDPASDALSFTPSKFEIPAFSRSLIDYSVIPDTLALGRQKYAFTPVVDGEPCDPVEIRTLVLDDFSGLTPAERNNGPLCRLTRDTYGFGLVKGGSPVLVQVAVRNVSSVPAIIRHCGSETEDVSAEWPDSVEPGGVGTINVTIRASALVSGANDIKIDIVTNSPLKPLLEAEIVGYVE